jgi:3-oxoacyl-[acyl-carrier protein] reductase
MDGMHDMDLGISGRNALVCASSRGLGSACAWELARAGCNLVINGRDREVLEANADAIRRETGVKVVAVIADLDTEKGVDAVLAVGPLPDILVNNNGGPPPRPFREIDRESMMAGLTANMITPITLVQRVVDAMVERRFGRIVCITSATVKRQTPTLELSTGARIGLTGFLASVARSVAHANVSINFLLPGSFDTRRIHSVLGERSAKEGVAIDVLWKQAVAAVPAGRIGRPEEFGATCAFLCSAHAGYITGQSLLIDGGTYHGVF